ncbi:hypothetical protein [uncultured Psychromonas sp.]|uniref:YfaP family protein n=1 Tax=uncultured Psychromonas sp. TaxID=173974 RepID=UPI00260D114B|nr:hypothetical protein [uncultured Psychromonas sp.]
MFNPKVVALISCSLVLSACGDSSNDTVEPAESSATLNIQSKNYFTGDLIEGASISISSTINGSTFTNTGTTDENGELNIALPEDAQRIIVNGDADGYGEYSVIVTSDDQNIDLFLQPSNLESSFDPSTAFNLELSGLSIVSLPANAFVDENGDSPTGNINAELTIIDPSTDPELMPGNFETIDATTGDIGLIESFGAINATFNDAEGNSYNLADNQTATIRIPLATGSTNPPATIPLYHFNEETGYWDQEGTATLSADQAYYEGTVSHFSTWNADSLYESVQISGCLQDQLGSAVSNARIQTQGVDYSGQAITYSNTDGTFSISAKSDATVFLSAFGANGLSRTTTISTDQQDIVQDACITLEPGAAVVTLTWGENPNDLDTQFFGPDSAEGDDSFLVYYGNKIDGNAWLDVDDVSSYGPEVTTISSFPYAGRYSYAVKHFSGSSDIAASPARVELDYLGDIQIFSPPTGEASLCWGVFDFVVDDQGEVTIETNGTWESDSYCNGNEYATSTNTRSLSNTVYEEKSGILEEMINNKYYVK